MGCAGHWAGDDHACDDSSCVEGHIVEWRCWRYQMRGSHPVGDTLGSGRCINVVSCTCMFHTGQRKLGHMRQLGHIEVMI